MRVNVRVRRSITYRITSTELLVTWSVEFTISRGREEVGEEKMKANGKSASVHKVTRGEKRERERMKKEERRVMTVVCERESVY